LTKPALPAILFSYTRLLNSLTSLSKEHFDSAYQPESPEQKNILIARLDAEYKQLSQQWRRLSDEIRSLTSAGIKGRTPDQILEDQSKIEELTKRQEPIWERQAQIKDEMSRLFSEGQR
jgi:hypothetical protein